MRLTIVLIFALLSFSQFSIARQSCDWPFRTTITINETSGLNSLDYQVKLTLTGGIGGTLNDEYNWTSAGQDLRVYASNDATPLTFSIAEWNQATEYAEVWVILPSLPANTSETIYLYYGNESVATADSGLAPTPSYIQDRIKFHTRNSSADPESYGEAKAIFDGLTDNVPGYQCSHPTIFDDITNANQGGNSNNFIAYSQALFTVPSSGTWGVRYGADYGLGGGLYVNGIALDERWGDDLWWGGSDWNNSDVLSGTLFLSAGEHKLEIIGAEGCCDGGLTIQFYNGATGIWGTNEDVGIDLRSESCPVNRHTLQYGSHDVCSTDLALATNDNLNPSWLSGSDQSIQVWANNASSNTAPAPTAITINVPSGLSFQSFSGTQWSCLLNGNLVDCSYNSNILSSANSSALDIVFNVTASAGATLSLPIDVSGYLPDQNTSNDNQTFSIDVLSSAGIPASCSNPQSGLLARFFDISGYGTTNLNDAATYQALVDARANSTYVQGQTIFGNIDGSGNPFSDVDDNFLAIFEGYIYRSSGERRWFGVDGDDAIESWLDGSIISTYYGLHGPANSPQDRSRFDLNAGFTPVEFRIQEYTGGDQYNFYWSTSRNGTYTAVPESAFYHCAGDPNIQLQANVTVVSDPINGTSQPKAIPGAVLTYTVTGTNLGNISTDLDSTQITQAVASNNALYVADFLSAGPIEFTDSANPNSSGLSYTFLSLDSTTDNIQFSNDNGLSFNYVPIPDGDGYDAAVTHFQLNFAGTLKPKLDIATPSFTFQYQAKVE